MTTEPCLEVLKYQPDALSDMGERLYHMDIHALPLPGSLMRYVREMCVPGTGIWVEGPRLVMTETALDQYAWEPWMEDLATIWLSRRY